MNILITGANFSNKGAQLMLESLVSTIKNKIPNATICVSPLLRNDEKVKDLGIEKLNYPLFHYGNRKFNVALNYPWLVSLFLRIKGNRINGKIPLHKVDAVFDISGFAFGEKWGPTPLHDLSTFVIKMKKLNARFILFPQAFGPFSIGDMNVDIKTVAKNVDLLITRDQQSFNYVYNNSKEDNSKVRMYPDITLTFEKKIKIEESNLDLPFAAIVPNERMLDKASEKWIEDYVSTMTSIINHIIDKSNLNILMLIHAQGDSADARIGKEIISTLTPEQAKRVIFYVEENPVRLKCIIAKSQFLIGSRFHALASSLSSNVPSIATSWLHKYEMLFEDYDLKEFSFNDPSEEIFNRVSDLIDSNKNIEIRKKLKEINSKIYSKSELMWSEIMSIVK